MNTPIKRTHFNHGELLSPEKLNQISSYTDSRLNMLTRYLSGQSGVLAGIRNELEVAPEKGKLVYSVTTHPGVAVNSEGEWLEVNSPLLFDLEPFFEANERARVHLYLTQNSVLSEPFNIAEHDQGFAVYETQVSVQGSIDLKEDGVFIGTVYKCLDSQNSLRVDSSKKNMINPMKSHCLSPDDQKKWNSTLEHLSEQFETLYRMHLNQTPCPRFSSTFDLLLLELKSQQCQFEKLSFLAASLNKQLANAVNALRTPFVKHFGSDQIIDDILSSIRKLQQHASPELKNYMDCWKSIQSKFVTNFIDESSMSLKHTLIDESIADLRMHAFDGPEFLTLSGTVFKKIHSYSPESLQSSNEPDSNIGQRIRVSSSFHDNALLETEALCLEPCTLNLSTPQLDSSQDVVVIIQYLRRQGSFELKLDLNDQCVVQNTFQDVNSKPYIEQIGGIVKQEAINPTNNTLNLTLSKNEAECPITSILIYQANPLTLVNIDGAAL